MDHLVSDHRRLEALLDAATAIPGQIAAEPYDQFRRGLLRHIGIEEKVLLPAAQDARGGERLSLTSRLRLDHGAVAALLVPTPTPAIVATLRRVLSDHNELEEKSGGLYAACDALLASCRSEVVARMREYPAVRVSAYNDAPDVMPAVDRALERAGYRMAVVG